VKECYSLEQYLENTHTEHPRWFDAGIRRVWEDMREIIMGGKKKKGLRGGYGH